jgi:hypothetical protein
MTIDAKTLLDLLPAVYRVRDVEQGKPLEALLNVIAEPLADFDRNLDQLYDDLFIETCADWVVPYIGDLVGHRPLAGRGPGLGSPRAEVANTIRYRRRKGTAAMLEQLARDVTGWDARVVEFFEWVGWNQYMQHTRTAPPRGGTLNVRDHDACERVTYARGAFDTAAHFVDVRDPARRGGRYQVTNVGVFLWRLRADRITGGDVRIVAADRFTFNPLGLDVPLCNPPQGESETDITHLAGEVDVPGTLRRRVLHAETEGLRRALVHKRPFAPRYLGAPPAFRITLNDEKKPIPPEEILICHLGDWRIPADEKHYDRDGIDVVRPIRVAVDPELGRLTFPASVGVDRVTVDYAYGCVADIGGGPYPRPRSVATLKGGVAFQIGVSRDVPAAPGVIVATLDEAVTLWNTQPAGTVGVIALLDSRSYAENLTGNDKILVPEGSRLLLVAAQWPEVDTSDGLRKRVVGQFVPSAVRPHIQGDVSVCGTARADSPSPGEVTIDGLLIEGAVTVLAGNLGRLTVTHSTIAPGPGELAVNSSSVDREKRNAHLEVTLDHSITGAVSLPEPVHTLRVVDSIVASGLDGVASAVAIDAPHADAVIERSTIFGATAVRSVESSNAICTGPIIATRRQVGCVRFSFIPPDSLVPRRHRCQPDLEVTARLERAQKAPSVPLTAIERLQIVDTVHRWLVPAFTSTRYGVPGYAQLLLSAPLQIRAGADDEAEMGAFHDLFAPQRDADLRTRLEEFLRFGLTAGIVYVS